MKYIELEILGLSSALANTNNSTYALILQEIKGRRRLPVIIGAFEAQAIALELENFHRLRPLTHDLFYETIKKFDATIEKIVITDIKEGIFYSSIYISQNTRIIELDARPSDAVALAVRFRCPIFAEASVLDEAGVYMYEKEENEEPIKEYFLEKINNAYSLIEDDKKNEILKRIETLKKKIEEAISNEDYELAARLRDEIERLENPSD